MKTILVDTVHCFIVEKDKGFGVFQDMYSLLKTYPNRKILLTSANEEQRQKFGIYNMPFEVFTLNHYPEKKDPKYYQTMLENFNLGKEDVIYFEHNLDALKSAQSVGINTYYYDNDQKDLMSLKEFLDDNL